MKTRRPVVDLSLGITPEAMMILHALHETEETFLTGNIHTVAWYNGRERGVLIAVTEWESGDKTSLCMAFGRDRNSDCLFIDTWFQPVHMNPPSCHDAVEKYYYADSYKRHEFRPGRFNEVAEAILGFIREFLAKRREIAKKSKPTQLRRVK